MAARTTGSATISFGLVSIPIKLYSAVSPQGVSFNMLHKTCGTRVRMQYYCPFDKEVITRQDVIKGYEHDKDQFVRFDDKELRALEAKKTDQLDILEFVPEASVEPVYIADVRYAGPGKGADRAYKLLNQAMTRTGRVAVGRFWTHGKVEIVMLRPYKGGLLLHHLHYANEVNPIEQIDLPGEVTVKPVEEELADRLVEQLSVPAFQPEQFHDEYRERVLAAVEQKVAGKEVTPGQAVASSGRVIDLFEALSRSLASAQGKAPKGPPGNPDPAFKAGADKPPRPLTKASPHKPSRDKKPAAG
jgi:DNA end-binding protein Ku